LVSYGRGWRRAQQLIAQHSGLWDLLAARAASRAHS